MSEGNFALEAQAARKLFRPHSRAMNCRQLVWSIVNQSDGKPVTIMDMIRDHGESGYKKMEWYKACRKLVQNGLLVREDISWSEIVRGKERIRYRCAVRLVPPWTTNSSRKW